MARGALRFWRWGAVALSILGLLSLAIPMFTPPAQAAAPLSSTTRPAAPQPEEDSCALPPPEEGRQVLLAEALRLGLVAVTFKGTDATSSLDLTVANNSDETVTVEVPPGTPIEPDDDQVQKMITGPSEPITVEPGQEVTNRITAYCTENFKKAPPSDGSVALKVGDRTPKTEKLATIIAAADYLRRLETEFATTPPGAMERANPDRFWASVALWSIYRTTDRIGPKEFNQVILEQLLGRTTPKKAAATANRITDETFEMVDLVYALHKVVSEEPLKMDLVRPAGKWCGQDREDDGTFYIDDPTSAPPEALECPDCTPYKEVCVDIIVIGKQEGGKVVLDSDRLGVYRGDDAYLKGRIVRTGEATGLKPSAFDKDGLADVKGKKGAETINAQVADMMDKLNAIWKWCCLRFVVGGLYAVDPNKAKSGVDPATGKKTKGKTSTLKDHMDHFNGVNRNKGSTKTQKEKAGNRLINGLNDFLKNNPELKKSKCLKMFLYPGYWNDEASEGEAGRATLGGKTSVVDDGALGFNAKGRVPAHELGHNLGLQHGEKSKTPYPKPTPAKGKNRANVMDHGHVSKPYVQDEFVLHPDQCKKAKAAIAKRGLSNTDEKEAKKEAKKLWEVIEALRSKVRKAKADGAKPPKKDEAKEGEAKPAKKVDLKKELADLKAKRERLRRKRKSDRGLAKAYRDNNLPDKAQKYDERVKEASRQIEELNRKIRELEGKLKEKAEPKKPPKPATGDKDGKKGDEKTPEQELEEKEAEWKKICCDKEGMVY